MLLFWYLPGKDAKRAVLKKKIRMELCKCGYVERREGMANCKTGWKFKHLVVVRHCRGVELRLGPGEGLRKHESIWKQTLTEE